LGEGLIVAVAANGVKVVDEIVVLDGEGASKILKYSVIV